ncbi:mRNA interferase MqsR (plasmid) [Yersinia similis]|uniref:mRNA interferase MqsR n=1 Tax=Yersinia similis TaxID=367190 RepID=A0ABM5Q4G7_9GAMM|nr:type II toxin-antitoxin system MqsR family toxin [Yersinia similis]AHK22075.1 mRNA interferase MqsR [Yersinia similis]CFQ66475.1 Quorum-sensing regulator [Yersinia similis]CNB81847.1 Quorum-sensing regulator [Yersinia similis]
MEKRTPHCKLSRIRELVQQGEITATNSALMGAAELGLSFQDMCDAVLSLSAKDFYKSMTTYADHTVWQDVYRPELNCGDVYLKLTVSDGVLVVSFKRL